MPIVQYVNIFVSHTPWYGICLGIGLLSIGIWMLCSFKVLKLTECEQNQVLCGFPFMVIVGVSAALLLDAFFTGDWRTWALPVGRRFGFTFTGWLLGVIVFIAAYGPLTSFTRRFLYDMLLPVFALAQGIGRIGCFLGGCCYGCNCRWGVHYPPGSLPYEQMGASALFPVQLVEALALFVLFVLCIRRPFQGRGCVYLWGVGIIRFVLDFFRADFRGSFGGLNAISPQQIMSCVFVIIGIIILLYNYNDAKLHCKNRKQKRAVYEV